jgi:hypothetical protein
LVARRRLPAPGPAPAPPAPHQPAQAFQFIGTGILEDEQVKVYRSVATGLLHVGPIDRHGPERPAPSHLSFTPPATRPLGQGGKAPYVATAGPDRVTRLPSGGRVVR